MKVSSKDSVYEISDQLDSENYVLGFRRFLDLCLNTDLNRTEKLNVLSLCDVLNASVEGDKAPAASFISEVKAFADLCISRMPLEEKELAAIADATEISKSYRSGQFYLKPINISVLPGELIGVVGENGNGKTTLLRMIASDLSLDEGSIDYLVTGNFESSLYDVKRNIAYIPQRIPRWYGKLKNNLHFAASSRGIYGFENEYLVKIMVTRLGLNKYQNLFWTQISSGYRTRFELARILLLQPKLLILDEPLANLDINAQQTFLQDLRNIAKSEKSPLAVLFSSQQLHEVEKVADHIVFLRHGESIYNSTVDNKEVLEAYTETEVETTASRENILQLLQDIDSVSVKFQGGIYIIRCENSVKSLQILKRLLDGGVEISYYRDLTHSTKKFFNQA
jgi:ABC-2 type transport system ATP-binding protein